MGLSLCAEFWWDNTCPVATPWKKGPATPIHSRHQRGYLSFVFLLCSFKRFCWKHSRWVLNHSDEEGEEGTESKLPTSQKNILTHELWNKMETPIYIFESPHKPALLSVSKWLALRGSCLAHWCYRSHADVASPHLFFHTPRSCRWVLGTRSSPVKSPHSSVSCAPLVLAQVLWAFNILIASAKLLHQFQITQEDDHFIKCFGEIYREP